MHAIVLNLDVKDDLGGSLAGWRQLL